MTTQPARTRTAAVNRQLVPASDPVVEPVHNGVFFALPPPLPRGRHQLTREQVKATQRERLLAATTELLAAYGYRRLAHADIAARAGVSLAAFYDSFRSKEDAIFAGYDRFIEVLLTRMTEVSITGKDRPTLVKDFLAAYLETLQSDLVVARAYQVEIDALGPAARRRRRESLKMFATYLRDVADIIEPDGRSPTELPWSAYIGVVYAARQLASDALDEADIPDFGALAADLQIWLADLFREFPGSL